MELNNKSNHQVNFSKHPLFDTDFVMVLDQDFMIAEIYGSVLERNQIPSTILIGNDFTLVTKIDKEDTLQKLEINPLLNVDWKLSWNNKEICFQSVIILDASSGEPFYYVHNKEVTVIKKFEKVMKQTIARYESLANVITSGVAVLDVIYDASNNPIDFVFAFVNHEFCEMTHFDAKTIMNKKLSEISNISTTFWHDKYVEASTSKQTIIFDRYSKTAKKWYSNSISFQEPNQIIVMMVDITERIELLEQYDLEKKRLSRVIDSSIDIIFEIDSNMRYVWTAGKGLAKIGKKPDEYIGKTVLEVFGEDGKNRIAQYQRSLTGEECSYSWQYVNETETFVFDSTISPIILEDGTIVGAVGVARDVTEQRFKQDEIEYLSFHDQLTNIYNRRFYEQQLPLINTVAFLPLSLAVIDVNGLKLVNDAFGHESGDIVLSKIAEILSRNIRSNDILARIGGDEFVILMPNTTTAVAKELLKNVNTKISEETIRSLPMSISYGIHTKEIREEEISDVFRIAEDNMYSQKLSASATMKSKSIDIIMKTLFEKNDREEKHCQRVSDLSVMIAKKLRFSDQDIAKTKMAGLLHDIGKIVIDADILNKPGPLSDHEWAEMRRHPDVGYRILSSISEFAPLANIILSHHERWDGTGYPRRLSGEEIPLFSRIMAVADAYDAMTMARPYRESKKTKDVLAELRAKKNSQFDPRIVDVFLQIIEESNDPGLNDILRYEKLIKEIKQLSYGKLALYPKKDYSPTSIDYFLKDHGFSGYTFTYDDDKVLHVGYKAYIPLREMGTFEQELPWRILQPFTVGEEPIMNAGLCISGVIGTSNPRGTGALYHNVNQTNIVINSKYLYGYQGDVWGANRFGVLRIDKTGTIIEQFKGDILSRGITITLAPKEYLVTLFEADRNALGGPMESFAISSHFEKGKKCKIEHHEALIYHGD